ncbi:MAG: GDSL-type esterase/lipase family protein [Verrucomicrobiae bacterium]|nr:GDSL-type esterase/lipase family protein [Verrucomicrobiae bacterium]
MPTSRARKSATFPTPSLPFTWWLQLVVSLLLLGCAQPSLTNYPPKAGTAWVALGDSLTAGIGAEPGDDYPSQLGRRLGREILNFGVPGDTTADALRRLDTVLAADPRVVLVCLGGNDSLQRLPLETTLTNLRAIITGLQQHGAFVVLIGVRSATVRDQYHRPFRQLARELGALYIPNILRDVLGNGARMADPIHPNAAGYAFIAERLERELRAAKVTEL